MTNLQDSLLSGNRRLRLTFEQTADRVAHGLFAGDEPLLASVEGSAADAWPASPPLQSLLIEPRPNDSAVALLVGMAGKSHWSASVEPRENGLLCDLACRIGESSQALGSTYRILAGQATEEQGAVRIALDAGRTLTVRPLAPATLTLSGDTLRIVAPPAVAATKQTVRWRYEVLLEG